MAAAGCGTKEDKTPAQGQEIKTETVQAETEMTGTAEDGDEKFTDVLLGIKILK